MESTLPSAASRPRPRSRAYKQLGHWHTQSAPLSLQTGQAKRVERIVPHAPIVAEKTRPRKLRRPRRQTPAPAVRAGRAASSSDSFGWPWARPSATTRICRARMKIPVHLTGRGRWGSIRWSERPSRWGGTPRGGLNLRPMLSAQAAITAQLRQRRLPESHEQYRVSTVRRAAQRPNGVARYTSAIAAFRGTAKAEHLPL
jgi:hypothetical protein